jgi:putative DNA primase/helicase
MSTQKDYNTLADAIVGVGVGHVETTYPDGEIHRFEVPDDKPGQEAGWYIDFGHGGVFGNWRTGEKHKFFNANLSHSERRALIQKIAIEKKAREEAIQVKQDKAAGSAQNMWENSRIATTIGWVPDDYPNHLGMNIHGYPLLKKIMPYNARTNGDWLVIPMWHDGQIVNVQKIDWDGNKRFFTGARVKGAVCPIGNYGGVIYICEGYATGCSLYEHIGHAVAVAFNAGNLYHAAISIRQMYPGATIIMAADNDVETEKRIGKNPGLEAAMRAASAVDAKVIYPVFEEGYDGTDFNDYFTQGGGL